MLARLLEIKKQIIDTLHIPFVRNFRRQEDDFSIEVPLGYEAMPSPPAPGSIASVCHIFYPDLAMEMRQYLENIPYDLDLFISTDSAEKAAQIRASFNGWAKGIVTTAVVANRGRDIAPKLITFADIYNKYDFVLFLHSKQSKHMPLFGLVWRRTLFETLCGSSDHVRSVFEIFQNFPEIGMVICQHYEPLRKRKALNWGVNFRLAQEIASCMAITIKRNEIFDFPSGSMFWTRSAALRPILDLHLKLDDFPVESGQIDGTIAQAIERLFLYACEDACYSWVKIADRSMFENGSNIISIQDKTELASFFQKHKFSFLK